MQEYTAINSQLYCSPIVITNSSRNNWHEYFFVILRESKSQRLFFNKKPHTKPTMKEHHWLPHSLENCWLWGSFFQNICNLVCIVQVFCHRHCHRALSLCIDCEELKCGRAIITIFNHFFLTFFFFFLTRICCVIVIKATDISKWGFHNYPCHQLSHPLVTDTGNPTSFKISSYRLAL